MLSGPPTYSAACSRRCWRKPIRGLRRASCDAVRLIDATSVSLTAHAQNWAGISERGCGAKLHVVLDPDAVLPVHFVVTSRRVNDITPAKAMPIEAGATYVFDLGYYDFSWWAALDAQGCRFITRLKTHTRPILLEEREVEAGGSIIADRVDPIAPTASHACPAQSARMPLAPAASTYRLDTGNTSADCSSLASASVERPGARTIAELYKRRAS